MLLSFLYIQLIPNQVLITIADFSRVLGQHQPEISEAKFLREEVAVCPIVGVLMMVVSFWIVLPFSAGPGQFAQYHPITDPQEKTAFPQPATPLVFPFLEWYLYIALSSLSLPFSTIHRIKEEPMVKRTLFAALSFAMLVILNFDLRSSPSRAGHLCPVCDRWRRQHIYDSRLDYGRQRP